MTSKRNPERGFMYQKKKKWSAPIETEYPAIENAGSSSIRQWKKGTTLIVGDSMLAGIAEKRISGNRSVKVLIVPSATTHGIDDLLKILAKKESRKYYLAYWNQ